MTDAAADVRAMALALQLAERGLYTTDPNPRVGCVIVKDGAQVGEGWHERAGGPHAEVHALRQALGAARGATAYVTLEPCCHHGRTPPCSDALVAAGVARVVAAMLDPNPRVSGQGLEALRRAGIAVEVGLMQPQAEALNPGFIRRMRSGLPHVRVKLAASMDGRTAMASGESKWITGAPARSDVQRLRARSSVVLTGIGTVLADDPALTLREIDTGRQPLRVVVDADLALAPDARILASPGSTLVVTASENAKRVEELRQAGAEILCLPGARGRVDLVALMKHLAAREMNEVLVEAGAKLSGALLAAGLVDELVIYLAPHLMGGAARGMFAIPELNRMQDRIALDVRDVRAIGKDWRVVAGVSDARAK
ncbi:MAG: bifunctional diaminohydroxyphosphoribosylaminopyrimidine deaminase/5-amino-6-(5-phosphoribosylamino)uracil reductase RibD [Acidiferrobacterales bacterium]